MASKIFNPGWAIVAALLIGGAQSVSAAACSTGNFCGIVKDANGVPMQYVYVSYAGKPEAWNYTDAAGAFNLATSAVGDKVLVQPATSETDFGDLRIKAYSSMPRYYSYNGETSQDISLPDAGNLLIHAYDQSGKLMTVADFKKRATKGFQYMYGTNLDNEEQQSLSWYAWEKSYDEKLIINKNPDAGYPDLIVPPGASSTIQMLFWEVKNYGKLWLKADNEGQGYKIAAKGGSQVIELNSELAKTAVYDLQRRAFRTDVACDGLFINKINSALKVALSIKDPIKKAAASDNVLSDALRARDCWELRTAQAQLAAKRRGNLWVIVKSASGAVLPDMTVSIKQTSHDMMMGTFEGAPYSEIAWQKAKTAGFDLATILFPWPYTQAYTKAQEDLTYGVSKIFAKGLTLKAHGQVWLQRGFILPKYLNSSLSTIASAYAWADIRDAMITNEKDLLANFADKIKIWETINEPATTNSIAGNVTSDQIVELANLSNAAVKAKSASLLTLINNPDELDFGNKYRLYRFDNSPVSDMMSYTQFLSRPDLTLPDIIGIQFSSGPHLNSQFGGIEGPAMSPSFFFDLLKRYAKFGKDIHITELSAPSDYASGWNSGYWREKWNERTQADYASAIYTIAMANTSTKAVQWWDVRDNKASLVSGGLLRSDGQEKMIYGRLKSLISGWTTNASAKTNRLGKAVFTGYSGRYTVTVTNGKKSMSTTVTIPTNSGLATANIVFN